MREDQHLGLVERTGCFVYLLLQPIRPRSRPSDRTADITNGAHKFEPGQMVAVDAVRHNDCCCDDVSSVAASVSNSSKYYLRLSDGSGWIPSTTTLHSSSHCRKKHTSTPLVAVQEVKVERGIWSFYVDNSPVGQALRRHPIDSLDSVVLGTGSACDSHSHSFTSGNNSSSGGNSAGGADGRGGGIVLAAMQKVYCDRKVVHPQTKVCFYRVQGINGWVFDRRYVSNSSVPGQHLQSRPMLIEISKVKTGLFCFQALVDMVVRRNCSTSIESATQVMVKKGQSVAVDIIRASDNDGEEEGPYLRLTDGSGWLYTHMGGVEMMREIPVTRGIWELKVLNPPVGVSLRRHPLDCRAKIYNKIYPSNSFIQADYLIRMDDDTSRDENEIEAARKSKGVKKAKKKCITFYRVKGTTGWVFDRRGDTQMLELLTEHDNTVTTKSSVESTSTDSGWTTEFVRGVAATIEHVSETEYSPSDQVLTFETSDDILIVVYCTTRTVGVRPSGQSFTWYRNCTPKELWEHFKKDLVEIMTAAARNSKGKGKGTRAETPRDYTNSRSVEKEEEMRNDLLRLDEEVEVIQRKRVALLEKIRIFDRERAEAAWAMKQQALALAVSNDDSVTAREEKVMIIHEADEQRQNDFRTLTSKDDSSRIDPTSSTEDPSSGSSSSIASFTIPEESDLGIESEPSDSSVDEPPRYQRLEPAVQRKRTEVRHRIMQLLDLKSQETTEFNGAFADSYTVEENATEDDGEGVEVEGDTLGDIVLDDTLGDTVGDTLGDTLHDETNLDGTTVGGTTVGENLTFDFTLY